MTKYLSKKITNLSIICAIMVVMIHSTTDVVNLPGSMETTHGLNVSTFIQMFFSEGLARIAVPLFFLFSGFLFFYKFEPTVNNFKIKYKKRFFSQVIPYLFWSIFTFLLVLAAQISPKTAQFFSNFDISSYSIWNFLNTIFIKPINSPLWFLRDLIVLTVLSPLIYILIKRLPAVFLALIFIIWVLNVKIFIVRSVTPIFFCTGAFLSIFNIKVNIKIPKIVTLISSVAFLALLVVSAYHYCTIDVAELVAGRLDSFIDVIEKIFIPIGIISFWGIYDLICKEDTKIIPFAKNSFVIYASHALIVRFIRKILFVIVGVNQITSIVVYFLIPVIVISIIILICIFLNRFCPKFYNLISGNR
ncbi:succinyltransferase [Clostridia bacterium]|nr:succinyltransferase [Clostridia bacterium]